MKKRILIVLAALTIMLCVPIAANAEIIDSGECGAEGDNVTWTLDDAGTLTISGEGDMEDYPLYVEAPWYDSRSSITKVIIEHGVTSIGDNAFGYCSGLTSIDIPKSVTSIGDGAFSGCVNLTSINVDSQNPSYSSLDGNLFDKDKKLLIKYAEGKQGSKYSIPDSVTAIGDSAFSNCSSLKSVTIPKGVALIGESAFYGCSGLTSIDIPSGVTAISDYAFRYCSGLTNVIIPNNVTYIGFEAFYGCAGLKSVDIPDSVTSIGGGAFYECAVLTNITIPDGVSKIDWATFYGCVGLKSITIPDSITYIGGSAFLRCKSLPSIYIPEGVTYIGENAFAGCSGLTNIDIPKSVTSIGFNLCSYCTNLTSINVDSQNPNYRSLDGNLFDKDQKTLMQYAVGKQDSAYNIPKGVTSISHSAFESCDSLTSIGIPKSVTSISQFAFEGCTGLSDVYYGGNESDWQAIKIDYDNDPLKKATIHYNYIPFIPETPVIDSISYENGECTFTAEVDNIPYATNLISVLYDQDNTVTGASMTEVKSTDTSVPVTVDGENAKSVKVFIWDSINGMRPLCEAAEAQIQ